DKSEDDINVLFFGDHLPNLFTDMEDIYPKEKFHETPWFIYMYNDRNESDNKYDNLSPMFFVHVLLKAGNYTVSPFDGLLDVLFEADISRRYKDYVNTKEKKILD